jgi:hypothetical protein
MYPASVSAAEAGMHAARMSTSMIVRANLKDFIMAISPNNLIINPYIYTKRNGAGHTRCLLVVLW